MDMEGLINRLPNIHDGANKWIDAFEEETLNLMLAIGDMKDLIGKLLGIWSMREIFITLAWAWQ